MLRRQIDRALMWNTLLCDDTADVSSFGMGRASAPYVASSIYAANASDGAFRCPGIRDASFSASRTPRPFAGIISPGLLMLPTHYRLQTLNAVNSRRWFRTTDTAEQSLISYRYSSSSCYGIHVISVAGKNLDHTSTHNRALARIGEMSLDRSDRRIETIIGG